MKICVMVGDLTTFPGDAVVNAANNRGLGGGGVDGAIHRAAGPRLLHACVALPLVRDPQKGDGLFPGDEVRIPTGHVRVTPGFDLPAAWVIHTVGPVWPSADGPAHKQSRARRILRDCFRRSAEVAKAMGLKSIAFPAISTGVYGCPQEECANVALSWVKECRRGLDVTFYIYPEVHLDVWLDTADRLNLCLEYEPLTPA